MPKQKPAAVSQPKEDIEITPEMIEAGAEALRGGVSQDLADGFLTPREVAVSVYRAMSAARISILRAAPRSVRYRQ
jgi:hypothetical protein